MSPAPAGPRRTDRPLPAAAGGFAARFAATEILADVLDGGATLDAALAKATAASGTMARLPPRDRGFARLLAMTALRRHGQIADALSRRIERPLPKRSGRLRRILEIAAAQILFLDTAGHAAVSIAVDQAAADRDARHFKGLANAVLRAIAAEREAILADQDALALNLPDWLRQRWQARYGEARTRSMIAAQLVEPALDLSFKTAAEAERWRDQLGGTVLANGSLRLAAHGPIEALPGYAEGAWWVQDAAATLPARLLGEVAGKAVADLCAAPGGKTAELAAAGADVTAYDLSATRLARLSGNLERLGLSARTVAADLVTADIGERYDAVLLDAPCSATGTIRRHPDVAWLKREADIAALAKTQAALLASAAAMLRPGGTLVYSTCSLEPEEGEAQFAHALGELPLTPLPIDPAETFGLAEPADNGAVRTFPDGLPDPEPKLAGLSGFFIARFRRD